MAYSKNNPLDQAGLRQAVLDLLSRRDYSRFEIIRKLSPKTEQPEQLEQLLDEFAERGWQSDQRFAEIFSRDRSLRYGPIKIRYELQQKGLDTYIIQLAMEALEVDWFAQAQHLAQRRFDIPALKQDLKLKAKAYRFLAQRGFSSEHINFALQADE